MSYGSVVDRGVRPEGHVESRRRGGTQAQPPRTAVPGPALAGEPEPLARPYADAAMALLAGGLFAAVFFLPHGKKAPPPTGWTGVDAPPTSRADVHAWIETHGGSNVGGRLAATVVAIDVDAYDGKPGAATLRAAEADLGPLPSTVAATSRTDGVSSKRFYRTRGAGPFVSDLARWGGGVEVLHAGHRYAVCPPSWHDGTGSAVRWVRADGTDAEPDWTPSLDDIPFLPDAWETALTRQRSAPEPVTAPAVAPAPGRVGAYVRTAVEGVQAELRAVHGWPEGHLESPGPGRQARGWQKVCADAAYRLGALTRMPGSPLTEDDARSAYLAAAPRGGGADDTWLAGIWATQHLRAAPAVIPGDWLADAAPSTPPPPSGGLAVTAEPHLSVVPEHPDDAAMRAEQYEREVVHEARRLSVREEAARRVRAERAGALTLVEPVRADAFLAVPDEPVTYRIEALLPVGGRAVLAAPYKAGKSTIVANLLRAFADGDTFLDAFTVDPPEGGVVLLDDELDPRMLRRWLRDQRIHRTERVSVVPLRGRIATLDILDPATRSSWASALRATGASVVILDCLRPVLDALGLSEDKEAGRFLVAFDALLAEAEITEAVIVHHTGHAGERSRGDSRIRDWPDAEWRISREKDADGASAPAARRYFTAFGRDVDVPEGLLTYEAATRRLTLGSQSRRDVAGDAALGDVLATLAGQPLGLSGRAVEDALKDRGHSRDAVRRALHAGRLAGRIVIAPGPRRSSLHIAVEPTGTFS